MYYDNKDLIEEDEDGIEIDQFNKENLYAILYAFGLILGVIILCILIVYWGWNIFL